MSETRNEHTLRILVAVDFAETQGRVVAEALRLAEAFSAELILLHVTEPEPGQVILSYEPEPFMGGTLAPDYEAIREGVAKRYHKEHAQLQEMSERQRAAGKACLALLVPGSETAETILEVAEKHHAEMIVMGTHGKGLAAKLLLGSTSSGVIKHARVPVHLVPAVAEN